MAVLSISGIQAEYDLAIAVSMATTGLESHYKPIQIALKIFETKSGEILADFQSLIKISKEDWDKGDPNSRNIHQITFERLEMHGSEPAEICKRLGVMFKISGVFERRYCFIGFNASFQMTFLKMLLLNGSELLFPEDNIFQYSFDRELFGARPLLFRARPINLNCQEMGLVEIPPRMRRVVERIPGSFRVQMEKPFPHPRRAYLTHHKIEFKDHPYTAIDVANDIHRAYQKLATL